MSVYSNIRLLLVFYQTMIFKDTMFTTGDDSLMRVEVSIGVDLDELNLSNMGLKSVDHQALGNLTRVKMLNISQNLINYLPKYVFENLTNLEYLDLANNRLTSGNFYEGLGSLEVLDISNNSIESIEPGYFYGVPKWTIIITKGLWLSNISAAMFENVTRTHESSGQAKYEISYEYPTLKWKSIFTISKQISGIPVKVCIVNNRLRSVKVLIKVFPPKGCIKTFVIDGILNLNELNIMTFDKGWFRLQNNYVNSLYLEYNRIEIIDKKLFNDLPRGINIVSLRGNAIRTLEAGIIKNDNPMDVLDLRDNLIHRIDNEALQKLNLTNKLYLDNNRLMNTEFMDSLPLGIQFVSLSYNKINLISVGTFVNFTQFHYLNLSHNEIWELVPMGPSNFSSLSILDLSYNLVTLINPHYFQQMENIVSLNMESNRLGECNSRYFEYILKLDCLSLASNGITQIERGSAKYLNHLSSLDLSNNPIKILGNGALYGLQKTNITVIKLENVPIEFIYGGVFDDM